MRIAGGFAEFFRSREMFGSQSMIYLVCENPVRIVNGRGIAQYVKDQAPKNDGALGYSRCFCAWKNAEVTCHFSYMANLDVLEFRKRGINLVVVRDHTAVIGQPYGVSGRTLFQHFDYVTEGERCGHLRSAGHRDRVRICDVVARLESSTSTI